MNMILNEKDLNYKIVNLVEIYIFHMKFFPSKLWKSRDFFSKMKGVTTISNNSRSPQLDRYSDHRMIRQFEVLQQGQSWA
jgi:hypothetical protein